MLISVILSTYSRCESLKIVLQSLLDQVCDQTFNYEVIVVGNNAPKESEDAVQSYVVKFNNRLKYFSEPIQGKAYAMNKGVREAKGDILAFVDDDIIIDSMWLKNLLLCFRQYNCDGVGGRVLPVYPEGTPRWVKDNAVQLSGSVVIYDYGAETKRFDGSMHRFIGTSITFKKEVFNECGLFRTDLGPGQKTMGEDTEFINRLFKKNKVLYYCGQALIWHPVDLKRLNLGFVAKWNIELGRFHAQNEIEDSQATFVYYFGIPRYLIRGVVQDFFALLFGVFSKKTFYNAWRSFFRQIGMIEEYWHHMHLNLKENDHA